MNSKNHTKRGIKALLLMLSMTSVGAMAQTNIVSLSGPDNVNSGKTFEVALNVQNETPMVAWQARIQLPEGFTVVDNTEHNAQWWKSSRGTANNLLSGLWIADENTVALASVSIPITAWTGNEGPICFFNVKVANDVETGYYEFKFIKEKFVLDTDGHTEVPYEISDWTVHVQNLTGVETVTDDEIETDSFNVLGQKVTENYTGVVIKNGQKSLKNNH